MSKDVINIDGLLNDASNIIDQAKRTAYTAVNVTLVARNWLLGKRIAEEDLHGMQRAEYGKQVIQKLSEQLTEKYGEGFSTINLWHFVNFHKKYSTLFTLDRPSSEIVYTSCKESQDGIIYTACKQSGNPIPSFGVYEKPGYCRISWISQSNGLYGKRSGTKHTRPLAGIPS